MISYNLSGVRSEENHQLHVCVYKLPTDSLGQTQPRGPPLGSEAYEISKSSGDFKISSKISDST